MYGCVLVIERCYRTVLWLVIDPPPLPEHLLSVLYKPRVFGNAASHAVTLTVVLLTLNFYSTSGVMRLNSV